MMGMQKLDIAARRASPTGRQPSPEVVLALVSQTGVLMSNHTYRVTEIVGTSETGVDDAIRSGITRAGETLRHLDWFEVTEIRGHIAEGTPQHYQVAMKVGFRLEDS